MTISFFLFLFPIGDYTIFFYFCLLNLVTILLPLSLSFLYSYYFGMSLSFFYVIINSKFFPSLHPLLSSTISNLLLNIGTSHHFTLTHFSYIVLVSVSSSNVNNWGGRTEYYIYQTVPKINQNIKYITSQNKCKFDVLSVIEGVKKTYF